MSVHGHGTRALWHETAMLGTVFGRLQYTDVSYLNTALVCRGSRRRDDFTKRDLPVSSDTHDALAWNLGPL
jgi:hypothetical protein